MPIYFGIASVRGCYKDRGSGRSKGVGLLSLTDFVGFPYRNAIGVRRQNTNQVERVNDFPRRDGLRADVGDLDLAARSWALARWERRDQRRLDV
jgi:hypothetical protein